MLPLAMVAAPALVNLALPAQPWCLLIAVFLPIFAFFFRLSIGRARLAAGESRPWQTAVFFVAIFILVLFDAVLILFTLDPRIAEPADWVFLWSVFALYLVLMAIALFPLERNDSSLAANT